jgi:hypothetical protein
MENLYLKIKEAIKKLQEYGIPIFFLRDFKKKEPSVSLTMMVISFNLCLFSLVNKFAKIVDGVDIENSLQLFLVTASLYFGRSFSKKMLDSNDSDKKD